MGIEEFETGILFGSGGGKITRVIPNHGVNKIVLKHVTGTFTTGTYQANSILKEIVVKLNGIVFEQWEAIKVDHAAQHNISALRELNALHHKVADTAEYFILDFFDALPKGVPIELSFTFNDFVDIGAHGDTLTTYTGSISIYTETKDKIKGRDIVRMITAGKRNVAAKSSDSFYMEGIPRGMKGYGILFCCVDGSGTAKAAEQTHISDLLITLGKEVIFQGSYADLVARTTAKAGIAANTGFAFLPLHGKYFNADAMRIKISTTGTPTDVDLNYWLISVNKFK